MSKAKGDKRERDAKEILENCGFEVEKRWNRKFGSNDYFGLFDLMASREDEFRFIQVKSNSTSGALKEIRQGSAFLPSQLESFLLEVWVCYDREGWKVHRLGEQGWDVVIDERGTSNNMGDNLQVVFKK